MEYNLPCLLVSIKYIRGTESLFNRRLCRHSLLLCLVFAIQTSILHSDSCSEQSEVKCLAWWHNFWYVSAKTSAILCFLHWWPRSSTIMLSPRSAPSVMLLLLLKHIYIMLFHHFPSDNASLWVTNTSTNDCWIMHRYKLFKRKHF